MFKNYNPEDVIVTFKQSIVGGYADGSMVTIERDEDAFTPTVGAQGDVVRTANANKMGTVTIKLLRESPTNGEFSLYAAADDATGLAYGQLQIKDLNGTVLCHAEEAWIQKLPSIDLAKETQPQEWVLRCAKLEISLSGATF